MKRKHSLILFSFLVALLLSLNVKSAYGIGLDEKENEEPKGQLCEYSEEYLEWLQLSEEERSTYIMPSMCKHDPTTNISKYAITKAAITDSRYSSVESGYITSIKNQYHQGSCWAFAANASLESYMKKNYGVTYDFSERHMEYATSNSFSDGINPLGFNREADSGGNIFLSSAYYLNKQGPILEVTMPFLDNHNKIPLNSLNNKTPVLDVNDINISYYGSCNVGKAPMKKHILQYGALVGNVYMDDGALSDTNSVYYNATNASLFYNGVSSSANHSITIVGWDDNYSKDNFHSINKPSYDGAWIVKNSYGTSWGKNGYFYVSYEDKFICTYVGGVTDVDTDLPDNNYFYDTYGWNVSFTGAPGYVANKFTKSSNSEVLTEVTVGVNDNSVFDVYLIDKKVSSIKLSAAQKIASSSSTTAGYKTVKFTEPIYLNDTEFTIIVHYKSSSSKIPLSTPDDAFYANVDIAAGKSFYSSDGNNFHDLKNYINGQLTIASVRAETNNAEYKINSLVDLSSSNYDTHNGGTINIPVTTQGILNNEDLTVTITKDEVDVTNKFTITGNKVSNNSATINVSIPIDVLSAGDYKIKISYRTTSKELTFTINEYKKIEISNSTVPDLIYTGEVSTLSFTLITRGFSDNTSFDVNVYDSSKREVTSSFDITKSDIVSNTATANIKTKSSVSKGSYKIVFNINGINTMYEFTVTEYIEVSNITLNNSKKTMVINDSIELQATIAPSNATINSVTWTSSNDDVATVDSNGLVKVLSKGTAIITVKSNDARVNKIATFEVVVINPSITISSYNLVGNATKDTSNIYDGYGGKITSTVLTEDIKDNDVYVYSKLGVDVSSKFTINKTAIVDNTSSIEIIVPRTVTSGEYYVLIKSKYYDGNNTIPIGTISQKIDFVVKNTVLVSNIAAVDVRMTLNDTNKVVSYVVTPTDAFDPSITFTSSNTDIVTVDEDGTIHPVALGVANITIKAVDKGEFTKVIQVSVVDEIFVSSTYNVNENIVTNINPNTTYETFTSSINLEEGTTITVYDNNNNEVTDGKIGTGYVIEKAKNGVTTKYDAIVFGDVNGDGDITAADYQLIKSYVMAKYNRPGYTNKIVTDNQIYAANVDFAGGITAADYQLIKSYVMVKYSRPGYVNRITQNHIIEKE